MPVHRRLVKMEQHALLFQMGVSIVNVKVVGRELRVQFVKINSLIILKTILAT